MIGYKRQIFEQHNTTQEESYATFDESAGFVR